MELKTSKTYQICSNCIMDTSDSELRLMSGVGVYIAITTTIRYFPIGILMKKVR